MIHAADEARPVTFAFMKTLVWSVVLCSSLGAGCSAAHRDGDAASLGAADIRQLIERARDRGHRDYRSAISDLTEAARGSSYDGELLNAAGAIALDAGDFETAAQLFRAAERAMPASPIPAYNLGITFEGAELFEAAMQHLSNALATDPDHLPSRQARARCGVRSGLSQHLAEDLEFVCERSPSLEWRQWACGLLDRRSSPLDDAQEP
jgi:tetratricopeptide (TPR) repeat protein